MKQGKGECKSLQAVFKGGIIELFRGKKKFNLAFCQHTK